MRIRFCGVLLGLVPAGFVGAASWQIDPAHTSAQFAVRHMMVSNVRGEFSGVRGTVEYDPADPARASVQVTIDTATLNTREPKRDAHLKSADFFDVANYPAMTFRSRKIEPAGAGRLKVTGDLTTHGATREVVLDVEAPSAEIRTPQGARRGATATAKLNRRDFGMTWNRALDAGGVVVGDEVTITLDVEMTRRAAPPSSTN